MSESIDLGLDVLFNYAINAPDACDAAGLEYVQAAYKSVKKATDEADAQLAASEARAAKFRTALEQIHNAAGAYISASSVYGDTDDIGLWKEVHTTARMALEQIGDVVK